MWEPVYLFAIASSVTKIKKNNNDMTLLQCALFYTHAIAPHLCRNGTTAFIFILPASDQERRFYADG